MPTSTKDGFETVFFAGNPLTGEIKLIQICRQKADKKTFDREYRGLLYAMEELAVSSGTIVTREDEALLDNNITAVPIRKWLLNCARLGKRSISTTRDLNVILSLKMLTIAWQ
jgi:uncharacterized protein